MDIISTKLKEVKVIVPKVFGDDRGWFMETYNHQKFIDQDINCDFIQDNHSFSKEIGTLRGLHFQKAPFAQAKLVRCTKGKIFDVAVDIRKNSPTYLEWVGVELTEENKKQLFIPRGFAHGFVTLSEDVEVQYKVDNVYSPENDRSIIWNDSNINIDWPINENVILSEKDKNAKSIIDTDNNFIYGEQI
ncbi:dTDP-4-dehydrorhamnose 3,5-epimerase [Macrococcus capreoli]|uniref:dTDP-4-dehydrorhamnose 3,5-epimerase n=1 Tax=Macrococcus capreoli TaxID=2982690 RepID=UPI0021D5F7BE|nr:dTDP-4-dehydrorhamnose 3,5-epimerase [Macrococcus sp. TMW 2.2395]MCU7557545.1 dTDP-4-dehydrorhamnose 3,5-epimerase [Macrococcus sp. TMW 2.2395]